MIENWQRLEKIIKWTGLSINSFALSIGLRRSENLYQIKKGNNGISRDLVELITGKYPSLSKGWLMTGEGEMFIDRSAMIKNIPYYGMDAVSVATTPEESRPDPLYHFGLPPFSDSTFAALTFKEDMQPEIPAGATVIFRRCEPENVVPGEAYLIISDPFQGIRKIRSSGDPGVYRLIPANTEAFDPIILPKKEIRRLYLVTGVILKRTV